MFRQIIRVLDPRFRQKTDKYVRHQIDCIDSYLGQLRHYGREDRIVKEIVGDFLENHLPKNCIFVRKYGSQEQAEVLEAKTRQLKQAYRQGLYKF